MPKIRNYDDEMPPPKGVKKNPKVTKTRKLTIEVPTLVYDAFLELSGNLDRPVNAIAVEALKAKLRKNGILWWETTADIALRKHLSND